MKTYGQLAVLIASSTLLGILCFSGQSLHTVTASEPSQSHSSWSKSDAENYLDTRGSWWLTWNGASRGKNTACISCHTGLPIAMAQPTLGKSMGLSQEDPAELAMISNVTARVDTWDKIVNTNDYNSCVAYYTDQKPQALGTESVMNALVLVNHDTRRSGGVLSTSTKSSLDYLWDQQQPDGSWKWIEFGLKPWESDGTYYGAALAAVAVGMAGKSYYSQTAIQPNIVLLNQYLNTKFAGRPIHDQTVCLWASTYLPGALNSVDKAVLIQKLLSMQDVDGGWSMSKLGETTSNPEGWSSGGMYPVGAVSDGFATGLVAMALKRSGISAEGLPLTRAKQWLITNEQNGSWPANYINGARDPSSPEGGFMRDASTSFAVLALVELDHK